MKFVFQSVFLMFVISTNCFSQGAWTWKKGNNTTGQLNNYTALGVPSSTNNPGGRYECAEWVDSQGNFWIYSGGASFLTNYSGMWKYTPATDMWTLMNVGVSSTPVYGTLGVSSATNNPGSAFVALTWADSNDNLWYYAGQSQTASYASDDLWKYNTTTNEWTWVKGSGAFGATFHLPIYGVLGISTPTTSPGDRAETSCSWIDSNDDLWLFGGSNVLGLQKNDIWKYNISSNEWTWMDGDTTFGVFFPNNYGIKGVSNPNNGPCSRWCYANWIDTNGDFWIFGGVDGLGNNYNDLWKYDVGINEWTWVSGTNLQNDMGTYGAQCVPSITDVPSSRGENRTSWVDGCGNFWLFGGTDMSNAFYNDLWKYNPSTNEWTWLKGSSTANQNDIYGTINITNNANTPGSRLGSVALTNNEGLWLFGGARKYLSQTPQYAEYNDLWLYKADSIISNFTYSLNCLDYSFTDLSTTGCNNILSWEWDFGDNTTSTIQNPTHIYTANGVYQVSLIVKNCTWDSDTITQTIVVNCGLNVYLEMDTICQGDCIDLVVTSSENTDLLNFVWDNGILNNNDSITVCPTLTTSYSVIATNLLGEIDTATTIITVINEPIVSLGNDTTLCGGVIVLDAGNSNTTTYLWQDGSVNQTLTALLSGTYFVEVSNAGCTVYDTINVTINGPVVNLGSNLISCNPNLTVDAGNIGSTYVWQDGSTNQTLSINNIGMYYVDVTDVNNCTSTDTIVVTAGLIQVDLGPDITTCSSNPIVLNAGNFGLSYLWSNNSTQQTLTVSQSGVYFVEIIDGVCIGHDTIKLSISSVNTLFEVSDTIGCGTSKVKFKDLTTATSQIDNWLWVFGDNKASKKQHPTHEYSEEGTYQATLNVTTVDGCTSSYTREINVIIYDQPVAKFSYAPKDVKVNDEVQFEDLSFQANNWEWTFGDGQYSNVQHPTNTYKKYNTYIATLIVSNHFCKDTARTSIKVEEDLILYVPNAFTPDNIGYNNYFQPIFTSGFDPYEYHLRIFNRWGEIVFESFNSNSGWNGTYNNKLVQTGVYVWKIEFGDINNDKRHSVEGFVTLLK